MCLFPRLIKNKRYLPNKKNGGIPPICDDFRKLWVPVGCGVCMECMQQKALQWKVRLAEEIKVHQYAYFVTFTFSPNALKEILNNNNLKTECNAIAGIAVRRFLERWRKKYRKSIKHWLITELGHENTERIHLHGVIFSDFEITREEFNNIWKYGNVDIGDYCNLKTINYIAKYITKIDNDHKNYRPDIFCSAGIGKNYIDRIKHTNIHTFNEENTITFYRFNNGSKVNLPIYYRNHLFSEDEREKLWIHKLDENVRYVNGVKIENFNTIEGYAKYERVLKKAQERNLQYGFGDCTKEWKEQQYNVTRKMLMKGERGQT